MEGSGDVQEAVNTVNTTSATTEPVSVEESLLDPSPPPEAGATEKRDDVEESGVSRAESDPVASNVSAQLNRSVNSKRNPLPKRVQPSPKPRQPATFPWSSVRYIPMVPVPNAYIANQSFLSSTNLYIRGLPANTTDLDLVKLCEKYGKITSTKAILDKQQPGNACKGYGFVDFESPVDAQHAVEGLQATGILAQFARQQEQDPTNLYISNLPAPFGETDIENLLAPFGPVVSTRILRDQHGLSKCVGFARLETRQSCEKAIAQLNGTAISGSPEPLMVKFADCGSSKKKMKQSKWKTAPDYVYGDPSLYMPHPAVPIMGGGRGLMQQSVVPQPYMAAPVMQTYPVSGNVQSSWQPYLIQPSSPIGGNTVVEGMHHGHTPAAAIPQLTAQLGHMAISATTASGYSSGTHGAGTQYHVVSATQPSQQYPCLLYTSPSPRDS